MSPRITKIARDTDKYVQPVFFYGSAREGMSDFLESVASPGDRVLMPAYIGWSPREGSGVFDPVRQAGTPAVFYELNADLTVDLHALKERLATGKFRFLVVIHYFGRTEPRLEEIRALADQHDIVLIEDLAHGFFSAAGVSSAGRFGHVSLYSLHKMFPFEQGGMVTYEGRDLIDGQRSSRPEFAAKVLSYDWRAISDARRRNFTELADRLSGLPSRGHLFELLWPVLSDGDVPQTLPVRILGSTRDAIYTRMNEDGFGMVSLYHTLISDIGTNFRSLRELSEHIINFPVHQDTDAMFIPDMVDSFTRHLANGVE
jgi:dTDP-4-amino-4,6-dideoxygalactose transaminase